jgi:hypothetical protein
MVNVVADAGSSAKALALTDVPAMPVTGLQLLSISTYGKSVICIVFSSCRKSYVIDDGEHLNLSLVLEIMMPSWQFFMAEISKGLNISNDTGEPTSI